jgi:histidinol dehydrogenase
MLAQAEHSPGASILISWERGLLDEVERELDVQCEGLTRGDLARQSLADFGALVFVRSAEEAAAVADEIAPEHLHLAVTNPEELLAKIPHAGAAFLGHYSPVAVGDYAAGPSHVLPTGGTARFASGLCANDFMRRTSVIAFNEAELRATADVVRCLAETEGLTAHRASVDVRLKP